jgi:tetratricopeptide (TPR) repeat protein
VATVQAPPSMARRVENALRDGRFSQAIDLAKQHAAKTPGPDADALLRSVYLSTAAHHAGRDAFRDAHTVLSEAEKLPGDTAWFEKLAALRADLGDHGRALQLAEKTGDPTTRARVLGRVADRGLREGAGGKTYLPPDLHAGFDLVTKAFTEYERGKDDQARETLNGIGLTSPYLEWKLLLRGLMAWSANDTPRALENWARLTHDRLPAKIAAPFRLAADRSFAATLPADRAHTVARQAEQITGGGLADGLRRIRKQLASEETLPNALDTARAVVPELKKAHPEAVTRLANSFYWAIVSGGQPEDMAKYTRLFGAPPDDPSFFRLQALVMESLNRLDAAHALWARYEEWIAHTPARWPGALGNRARALILERMGRLARDFLAGPGEDEEELDFFDFFSGPRGKKAKKAAKPKPLNPPADECFRRAAELAPDWVVPATELIEEYTGQPAKALAAVGTLLQRFPNNLATLESAARLYEQYGETAKARDCLRRALTANPLDRRLRKRVALLSLNEARHTAEAGDLGAARVALREAATLGDGPLASAVAALGTAISLRAGDAAELETHRAALSAPEGRVANAYRTFVEATRLKVKKKDLTPYQTAYTDALTGPMTAAELAALLDALDQYRQEPTAYRGLKTHEKKILDRVTAAANELAEDDLARLGLAVHQAGLWKVLKAIGDRGTGDFPRNPHFPFFVGEAAVSRQRSPYVAHRTAAVYRKVQALLDQDRSNKYPRVRELLEERLKKTPDLDRWLKEPEWFW